MCVVSYVGDYWEKDFKERWPQVQPWIGPNPIIPDTNPFPNGHPVLRPLPTPITEYVTKEEFEKLRQEMEELKKLLLAAKKYDEATGQPDCEMESKIALIKKLSEALGVDMKDVFGNEKHGVSDLSLSGQAQESISRYDGDGNSVQGI